MERRSKLDRRIAFALISVIASIGANAEAAENQVQLNWQLAPSDKAGSEKSGAACFPNGVLLWQELAKPDPQLLHSRLEALLKSYTSVGATVSGDIASLKAMVCAPWLGIGAQPKSEIKLSIRWSFQSDGQSPLETTVETSVARKKFDLRVDSTLLLEAVETSLQQALSKI